MNAFRRPACTAARVLTDTQRSPACASPVGQGLIVTSTSASLRDHRAQMVLCALWILPQQRATDANASMGGRETIAWSRLTPAFSPQSCSAVRTVHVLRSRTILAARHVSVGMATKVLTAKRHRTPVTTRSLSCAGLMVTALLGTACVPTATEAASAILRHLPNHRYQQPQHLQLCHLRNPSPMQQHLVVLTMQGAILQPVSFLCVTQPTNLSHFALL